MNLIDWNDVLAIHRAQGGISFKDGKVRSLLANQSKEGYADEIQSDKIFYRVSPATKKQSVALLKAMVGVADSLRVFEKLGVNQWRDHGTWTVADVAQEDDGLVFLLLRAAS